MEHDFSAYPEGTILSQLAMDVCAHSGKITILYDTALTQELLGLEFEPKSNQLYFEFTPGKMPYGVPLKDDIADVFEQVDTAVLLQVDTETDEIVFGLEVPVKLI